MDCSVGSCWTAQGLHFRATSQTFYSTALFYSPLLDRSGRLDPQSALAFNRKTEWLLGRKQTLAAFLSCVEVAGLLGRRHNDRDALTRMDDLVVSARSLQRANEVAQSAWFPDCFSLAIMLIVLGGVASVSYLLVITRTEEHHAPLSYGLWKSYHHFDQYTS
jgi:hypothetical protein